MHRFWDTTIRPVFDACQPRVITEVGCASGLHTRMLLDWCRDHGAVLHSVDPVPTVLRTFPECVAETCFAFHEGLSLDVLPGLPAPDAVLIDGDHNWYTVINELRILGGAALRGGQFPLVLLHDTGWPYGRRDMYYDPETVPREFRQEMRRGFLTPNKDAPDDRDGINGVFHHAVREGTPRNGIRTAVEDFMRETPLRLRYVQVDGLHGLGFLVPEALLRVRPALAAFLDALESPPLAAHVRCLESDRLTTLLAHEHLRREHAALYENWVAMRRRQTVKSVLSAIQACRMRLTQLAADSYMARTEESGVEILRLKSALQASEERRAHMEGTLSWRMTLPLRAAQAALRAWRTGSKGGWKKTPATASLTHERWARSRERAIALADGPRFTLFLPLSSTHETLLRRTLNSVMEQTYSHWEIVTAHCAGDTLARRVLDSYEPLMGGRLVRAECGTHCDGTLMLPLLERASGALFLPIGQHDVLEPHMLETLAAAWTSASPPPDVLLHGYDYSGFRRSRTVARLPVANRLEGRSREPRCRGEMTIRTGYLREALEQQDTTADLLADLLLSQRMQPRVAALQEVLYHRFS